MVDACIAIAEDNRAVSETEIYKRLIIDIGDRAAFAAFHEYGVVLTPIAIAVGDAHGHVGMSVSEEEACDRFSRIGHAIYLHSGWMLARIIQR